MVGIGVLYATTSEIQCSDLKLWGHTCFETETACDKSSLMAGPLSNLPFGDGLIEW